MSHWDCELRFLIGGDDLLPVSAQESPPSLEAQFRCGGLKAKNDYGDISIAEE